MSQIIQSKLGMRLTETTVNQIRETYAAESQMILSYAITRLQDGSLQATLGGDDLAQPRAIKDEIAGMSFYWYTSPDLLDEAKAFVFDKPRAGPTRLLQQ